MSTIPIDWLSFPTSFRWFIHHNRSYLFDDIIQLSKKLPHPEQVGSSVVYDISVEVSEHLPWFLAALCRGFTLLPLSESLSESAKTSIISKTKAISIQELKQRATTEFEHFSVLNEPCLPDLIAFISTSGTSGEPKWVPISRVMLQTAVQTTLRWIKPEPDDQWLLSLPLHHIGGLSILLRALVKPYTVVIQPRLKTDALQSVLAVQRISFVSLVPTQLKRLLDSGFKCPLHLKKILLGGGPCSVPVLQQAVNAGFTIINSFGMTETCAQFTGTEFTPGMNIKRATVGWCSPENEISIRTESGTEAEKQESGILWIKGPQVLKNYFSTENNEAFLNGWFNTGDYVQLSENHELEIIMRRTDRIVTGGENVNPNEVESYIVDLEGITDAAVFGIPDEEWGQKLGVLYTGMKQDNLALQNKLKYRLPGFKIPKEWLHCNSIPRISISKIDRKRLFEHYVELMK